MRNKGQTTVLFSLVISALLLFTITALEVGRIYMSRVKARAVVHSAQTSIMADYHRELFERYHLLFYDPTYGTGSEAVAEERMKDYIEESLNGGGGQIYQFDVEEIALTNEVHILEEGMEQLKKQITEYEKTAGVVNKAKDVWDSVKNGKTGVENAEQETEQNGQEIPGMEEKEPEEEEDTTDPRETLKESLKLGILSFVLPDNVSVSKEKVDYSKSPSRNYSFTASKKKDTGFDDISKLKGELKESANRFDYAITDHLAFADYVNEHFSNIVHPKEGVVVQCEAEYILEGKNNDYDNLEEVVTDMTWLRMPVNYVYLLSDATKKSEALTVAAAICTATGTPGLMEIVKYLLLGCWAYGESLHEMKLVLAGEKVPYVKNTANWYTDLKSLASNGKVSSQTTGMDYESLLLVLLTKEAGKDAAYARMLDVMEKNLQVTMPAFRIEDLTGAAVIQGKITVNPLFVTRAERGVYEYYFEIPFSYIEE